MPEDTKKASEKPSFFICDRISYGGLVFRLIRPEKTWIQWFLKLELGG